MFLWASLMINYINLLALLPSQRVMAIADEHTPEGLDDMYQRIMNYVTSQAPSSCSLAFFVFVWLAYGHEAFTLRVLSDAFAS